jgi:hypothetical protein
MTPKYLQMCVNDTLNPGGQAFGLFKCFQLKRFPGVLSSISLCQFRAFTRGFSIFASLISVKMSDHRRSFFKGGRRLSK